MKVFDIFLGNNGKPSAIRYGFVLFVTLFSLMWGWTSFKKCELQPINENIVWVLVVLTSGKAAQRYIEGKLPQDKKMEDSSDPPTQILNG